MARSTERIISRGDDTLNIYYCGVHGPNTGPKHKKVGRKYGIAIGLLTQRRYGLVSLHGGEKEGHVLTIPFVLPEGSLFMNADARRGAVAAELCDVQDEPIEDTGKPNNDSSIVHNKAETVYSAASATMRSWLEHCPLR